MSFTVSLWKKEQMWHVPMASLGDESVYNVNIRSFLFLMKGVAHQKLGHVNFFCQRATKMIGLFLVLEGKSGVERSVMW